MSYLLEGRVCVYLSVHILVDVIVCLIAGMKVSSRQNEE